MIQSNTDTLTRSKFVDAVKTALAKVARLADMFEALLATPPAVEFWPEWMARATALLAQYDGLLRELKPTLRQHLLIPALLPSPSNNSETVANVLLRTRLPPEVEEKLRQETEADEADMLSKNSVTALRLAVQVLSECAEQMRLPLRGSPLSTSEDASDRDQLVQIIRFMHTGSK